MLGNKNANSQVLVDMAEKKHAMKNLFMFIIANYIALRIGYAVTLILPKILSKKRFYVLGVLLIHY